MTYYEHSLLSVHKFGNPELFTSYLQIHKFIDSTKLLVPHLKHRLLLHNTYGAELAIEQFGDYLPNGILVRDVVFQHIKEDHSNVVPTLYDWYKATETSNTVITIKEFVNKVKNSIKFGYDYDYDLSWLLDTSFNESWCYSPNKKDLAWLKSTERCLVEKAVIDLHK